MAPKILAVQSATAGAPHRSELRLYLGDLWERLGEERGNQFFYYVSKVAAAETPGSKSRSCENLALG